MLFARESLLLGGGDDFAVTDKAGGAVMIEGGDAQNIDAHGSLLEVSKIRSDFQRAGNAPCRRPRRRWHSSKGADSSRSIWCREFSVRPRQNSEPRRPPLPGGFGAPG